MKRHFLYFICFTLLVACHTNKEKSALKKHSVQGETMGTYYHITYLGQEIPNLQSKIDSILITVNQSLSTYIDSSTISKVNQMKKGKMIVDTMFQSNFLRSKTIYAATNGYFNPAVMPLVNYWGFGYEEKSDVSVDSVQVEKLLTICDFDQFELIGNEIYKKNSQSQLDFSGIAKGYAVDVIAKQIQSWDIENYLVDIGGEISCGGTNGSVDGWQVAIRKPSTDSLEKKDFVDSFLLKNESIATSGNYENYATLSDGKTISHSINPKTGYPQQLNEQILSSTVVSSHCATADAYATAFKIMGLNESIAISKKHPELSVYFVYTKDNRLGSYTSLK